MSSQGGLARSRAPLRRAPLGLAALQRVERASHDGGDGADARKNQEGRGIGHSARGLPR